MAQPAKKSSAKNSISSDEIRLPASPNFELDRLQENFASLIHSYLKEAQVFATEKGLALNNPEVVAFSWEKFVKGVDRAETVLAGAYSKISPKELDRIIGDTFLPVLTAGDWKHSLYYIKHFVTPGSVGAIREEKIKRAAHYFATDYLMLGSVAQAKALAEVMGRVDPEFWKSTGFTEAFQDGIKLHAAAGNFSKLVQFVESYPRGASVSSVRNEVVEDALIKALPTGPRPIAPLLEHFALKEFVNGAAFQKMLMARMQSYMNSGDVNSILAIRDTAGAYLLDTTKLALKPALESFLIRERARIVYFWNDETPGEPKEAIEKRREVLSKDSKALGSIESYFGIKAAKAIQANKSKAA